MGGQCSSESSDELQKRSSGDDIELLCFKNAQLFLVDEDESIPMQQGEFKLTLTKQLHSPLAALLAIVKDVEWPVGRDCPVIKLGRGCYSFCLPGILYGLVLENSGSNDSFRQLEHFLLQYSTFEDHSTDIRGSENEPAQDFWNEVAMKVELACERLAWNDLRHPQHHLSEQQQRKDDGLRIQPAQQLSISPRMMKRVQQARRLSAIAKLFSRALLKGAISNLRHVTNNERARGNLRSDSHISSSSQAAVASVDAFAKVVEAVESPGKAPPAAAAASNHPDERHQETIESAWTLNRCGLELLVKAVTASTAINLSRASGSHKHAPFTQRRPPLPAATKSSKFQAAGHSFRQERQELEQFQAD